MRRLTKQMLFYDRHEISKVQVEPVYIHDEDRDYVMRSDPAIVFWKGTSYQLNEGVTLIHCGGHFAGSSVLLGLTVRRMLNKRLPLLLSAF